MLHRLIITLLLCSLAPSLTTQAESPAAPTKMLDVWIGTGTWNQSKGIYHATFDPSKGHLSSAQLAAEIQNPGFLAQHPSLDVIYSVGTPVGGEPSVAAFSIQGNSLKLLNSIPIGDSDACHLAIDPSGKTLMTAQYQGGSVAAFQVESDGTLKKRTELIHHQGGSRVVPGRQNKSHAHYVGFSPNNQFALVSDLGLDQVVIYRLDPQTAKLTPHGAGQVPAGGGPRHLKFHPNGKWVYVLNELSLSVTVFDWDEQAGKMSPKQTIANVSQDLLDQERFKSASEIVIDPRGEFVYAANRGHDTITVFQIDQATGKLEVVEVENVRGATPRNFNLSPRGKWLLAAGQDSNTIATFAVDPQTGKLVYHRNLINTPTPICILFGR